MRKGLFTLILAVVFGTCASVHAQTIVLSESFENGLPAGWTQESVIGSTSWTTEASAVGTLLYPQGAASGIGRAVLRNETGETQGYKTRLITPVMNLDTVFQPILRYYHAQMKWTADFDTLRVLYRNTEGGEWQLLQEFTQPIQNWKKEELDLPQPTAEYQLCFEGSDNLGRGIVLDSVMVRSKPECTVPHDMSVINMLDGGATLLWQASYDATDFQVVLVKSNEVLDIDTMSEATKAELVVLDATVANDFKFQYRFTSLLPATNYVAYVRSICEKENSAWGTYSFLMKAVKNVPYSEDFNLEKTSGVVNRVTGWTYGNNIDKFTPFVNTNQSEENSKLYVVDGSALCFTGDANVDYDIPAGQYVYAATPEMNVESMQGLQVRFWGSLGTAGSKNTHARSIIVGVAEDPADLTTFVPVDTMTLWKFATYEEHITTFANYEGEGKSVVFMSNFDKPNQFYIDNVTIEVVPAVAKVSGVSVVPAVTEATISWKAVASSYSVLVSDAYTTQVDTLKAEQKVVEATVASDSYKATGLTEGTKYYVYVKAEGSKEWSNAVDFATSCQRNLPMFFGFETDEGTYKEPNWRNNNTSYTYPSCIGIYSTDKLLPSISTSAKKTGKNGLYFSKAEGRDAWVVFPMVDTIMQGVEIEFYMKPNSTTYKNTALEIGVMTNPADLSTFEAVGEAKNASAAFIRFYANFLEYKGEGKYIALRWVINEDGGATGASANSQPYIDDVKIQPLSYCLTPTLKVDSVTTETATLSWKAPDMDRFQVLVGSAPAYAEETLNTLTEESDGVYYVLNVQDTTAVTLPVGKLEWGHTYYAYVRSVCSDTLQSYWSPSTTVTLAVPAALETPFIETFEGYTSGKGYMAAGWVKADPKSEYPHVYATAKKNGKNGLYMANSSTEKTTELYAPVMDVEDLSKLMITFWGRAKTKASETNVDSLYVGVGNDPMDPNEVITWMDTISIPTTTHTFYRLRFPDWKPYMGNRVVFSTKNAKTNSLYLDDIRFESFVNATPYDVELLSANDVEARFQWTAEATKGWNVLVTTESVNPADTASLDPSKVFFEGVTTDNPYTLTGLTAQTNYYVYVKPVEGHGEWSEELHVLTQCLRLKPGRYYKMDFEGIVLATTSTISSYAKSGFPECWVRHGADEEASSPSNTPFIYQGSKTYVAIASSNMHTGIASAQLKTTTDLYPAWFTTPELDVRDMSKVNVKFWARTGTVGYQMEFGVMLDPDDFTTYTKLADIKPNHNRWEQYTYLLSEVGYKPEMGNYLVFAMSQPKGWTFYIDDIEISASTCMEARPILSKLTHNSVRIAYSAEPTDVRLLLAKDYEFNAEKLNLSDSVLIDSLKAQGVILVDSVVSGQMGIQLKDLLNDTDYSAALLTICDDNEAAWAATSWTTMCPPNTIEDVALIDFEEGYNDTTATTMSKVWRPVPCWVTGNKAIAAEQTYIPYAFRAAKMFAPDSVSLRFYSNKDNDGAYAIMPALDVDDITKYEMTFLGRATESGSVPTSIKAISSTYAGALIVGVVTDPSDFSTFVAVDTVVMEDNDVHRCKVRFSAYTGDANGEYGKFVAFLSEFKMNNYFFVDNIAITPIEECGEPLDLSVDSISDTEAAISWNGTTDSYRVVVATEKLQEAQWEEYAAYVIDDTVSTPMTTLKGLTANTSYFVYVKALCGAGKWNLQGVNFVTNCPPLLQLPYEDNFDRYEASTSQTKLPPSCWVTFNKGLMSPDATYPTVSSSTSARYGSTGNGLHWYIQKADTAPDKRPMLVSLPIEDVSRVMITFKMKAYSSAYPANLAIGYATNVSCLDSLLTTVHFVDTVSSSTTTWAEYVVDMKDAESTEGYLVFQQLFGGTKTYTYAYMDDLKIEKTPSCFEPVGAEVLGATYDGATVQITPFFDTDTAWDVMMVSKDATDTVRATVDTTTAVVKGLKHSTYYTMYVRTNCGEGDVSAWSDKTVEFYTNWKMGDGTCYTFEHSEGVVLTPLSAAGSTTTAYAHPSFYIGGNLITTNAQYTPYQTTSTGVARSGSASMQFYNTGSFYQSWIGLPVVEGEDSLQIRFDMRAATAGEDGVIANINNYDVSRFQIGVIDEDYNLDSYEVIAEYKPSYITWNARATEANNYLFDQIVVPLPADLTGKRLVMMNPSRVNKSLVYVDNLCVEKKQGWQTPAITTSTIAPTTLTVDWTAPGSDKWNVYLTQNTANFPLANVPVEDIVAKQEGLTTASATFTGLQPDTEYIVYVQVAGQTDIAATSARRLFKTPADVKIATDSVITFEGVYTDSMSVNLYGLYPLSTEEDDKLLAMASNWYVDNMGTVTRVNTPWARLNGYIATGTTTSKNFAKVRVAYAGERALQLLPGTTNDQLGAYAVMPEVDGDYDTLQVNFYARPFYEDTTGMVGVKNTIYATKPLVVGVMSDPNNPATFELIDSLYYNDVTLTTSTLVADVKNKGFELFSFRLAGVKGKYIAFSAPIGGGHWYIDNIFFSAHTCIRPLEFEASDVTKNSAVLTWRAVDGNNCIVQLSTSQDFTDICYVDTVPANQALKVKDLKSITTYYARVCEMCDANNTSAWTNTSFTTECFEVGPGFTCGFEESEGRAHQGSSTSESYDIAQCWTSGTTYKTSSNVHMYLPCVVNSSGTYFYSRNTMETIEETANGIMMKSLGALDIYAIAQSNEGVHNVNNYDQWAVMPHLEMDAMDTDTMQLEFYALAGRYNPSTGKITQSYTGDSYLPSIVVGVMSDPADLSTFTPLDTCTYDMMKLTTSVDATPANGCMFQRFVVPLAGIKDKGEYIAFKTYLVDYRAATKPTASSMTTQLYLDDISVVRYKECAIPEDLAASEISATSVKLNWSGDEGASWIVNLSTDPAFANEEKAVLVDEEVAEMSLLVAGLDTATTYYWTVQQVCDAQSVSDLSQPATFKTAYVPMFNEEFMDKTIPMEWLRDTTRASYVFEGTPLTGKGITNAWSLEKTSHGVVGQHMSAPMNSGGSSDAEAVVKKSWFLTPIVQLDAEKEAWLTFAAALTRHGSDSEADKDGWDDQFMVVVSEDGGATWKRENAIVWNNETSNDPANANYVYGKGDYVLNELPNVADVNLPQMISLAKYKGKSIKIGFYSESTVINAYNKIHIGKVRINYVEYMTDEATSCQFADIVFENGDFYISGDNVAAGTYEYKKVDFASLDDLRDNPKDGLVDTLYTYTAHFAEAPEFVIEKTICEGEVAGKEWGFQDRSTSGVYRRKGESAVTGCDSIATLVLTVIPRVYTEEVVDICSGTSYEFNGKYYTETGVYVDTLSSVVTGCDSIATLILTVNPPITHEYEAHICTGSSYYFTENYPALTMSGKYIETLKTAEGCDSIVTLNLVVSDVIEIDVFDTICAGNSYEFDGKEYTEAGEYPITYTSSMGCDSVVTLHLYVNEAVALLLFDTICEGDTYVFDSLEYTEPGVYEFTYTSVAGCDSVVTLNLAWNTVDTVVVDTTINELDLPYFYPNTSLTYPKGTEPGVYVDTVMVAGDSTSCGYLLIHTLTIIPGTAVDNVVVGSLLIKPSLIEQGESVTITGFSGNKATVYVYDMVGRCVEQLAMTGNSIELNTFTTSGVYTVRVMDANGEQHVGRVMVK